MKTEKNKLLALLLVIFLFFLLFFILSRAHVYEKNELSYGITFSKKHAESLGLNWKYAYLQALDDLKIKKVRLPAYWNEIEKTEGSYDWSDLDWQVDAASNRDVGIILAVGGRLPRWPECHWPGWASELSEEKREEKILKYLKSTIQKYKINHKIIAWQIENEPFLPNFGECPKLNVDFLDKEIAMARSIDSRPIIITDSGELSVWVPAAKRSDIFGTTMYRDTYSNTLGMYVHYPIGPWFFKIKKNIAKIFAKPKDWIVIELAAEPWGPIPYQNLTKEDRGKTMDIDKFRDMLKFSRLTGFREFYLWGVEWWLWEKDTQNNPELWNEAKKLFNKPELAY